MTSEEIKVLINKGYRRVSNKYGHVARIDRPDWVEVLIRHLGITTIENEKIIRDQIGNGSWEDHYRRVCSTDVLILPLEDAKKIPTSGWDKIGYVEDKE